MAAPLLETKKKTTVSHSIKLGANDIFEMLRQAGVPVPHTTVTDTSGLRIFVHVPGGGDWSNTDLDISAGCPVQVEWQEKSDG